MHARRQTIPTGSLFDPKTQRNREWLVEVLAEDGVVRWTIASLDDGEVVASETDRKASFDDVVRRAVDLAAEALRRRG